MRVFLLCALFMFSSCGALPTEEAIVRKLETERYHQLTSSNGQSQLVDAWVKSSDVEASTRYQPDIQNHFHLYTRLNPIVSQPLILENDSLLGLTDYDPARRTVVLIHGWLDSVQADFNKGLVGAFLDAEDVNVIVLDWYAGAGTIAYATAVLNTVSSGESAAKFLNWLNRVTGATAAQYHLVGQGLGGHQAGVIGRNMDGDIGYITALDPASIGWNLNEDRLRSSDSAYTEVIHTNAGLLGYLSPLGHVDFYPNGGLYMPGCETQECDHDRSYLYLAESLRTAGFVGRRCASYLTAMTANCHLLGRLAMGGLVPKTGSSGVFYLETNVLPPFSIN